MKQYKIVLQQLDSKPFSAAWGYLFYGMFMQRMPAVYAELLHENKQTPICQYVMPTTDKNVVVWKINLMTREAIDKVEPLLKGLQEFSLDKENVRFSIISMIVGDDIDEICWLNHMKATETYFGTAQISILTPLGFKSNDEYVLYPTAELVVKSLLQKWNAFNEKIIIDDEDAIKSLINGLRITKYRLNSATYYLKGNYIPAMEGSFVIKAKLSAPIMELFKALLLYANYTGIGIKNSLGMGAVNITLK